MEWIGLAGEGDTVCRDAVPWAGECYDGTPESISAARCFTARFLSRVRARLGVPIPEETIATAQLVVSELVTNSCKYAPGPCLLNLEVTGGRGDGDAPRGAKNRGDGFVEITVWDADPGLPTPVAADPERVGRHGLEIVLAVSEGFEVRREPVGKRVGVRVAFSG
ncbi:ATP-binding protein [Streptomyces jumonjinensis]|uniref:ATP-binding protein n=1 Tax=Streptomyces jumonjinensis TaxID=1945 RepID=A0A646KDJ5_STRJU|nr:ATP-binding protein [Streptomyces jumonjinensis]MQT00140.1 ATP-binding protein [Streptomyces jumonjinensis]